LILRSKYVIPSAGTEIENGAVAIDGATVVGVGEYGAVSRAHSGEVRDFGEAVIIPGLVNAHTHLELSDLKGRIQRGEKFTHWLANLMRAKLLWTPWKYNRSVRNGVRECLASGTTTVGDISNSRASFRVLKGGAIRSVVFYEVLGFIPRDAARNIKRVSRRLKRIAPTELMGLGIAPHAPYSVSEELYVACKELARRLNLPLCTHIHETQSEIELMLSGGGEFRGIVRWSRPRGSDWQPPRVTPIQRLNQLGLIDARTLLVHCNYLNEEDMRIISSAGASVVFCPRSHAFFGHSGHPFAELRRRGVNVCLGTDSLASNDSLSMLDEIRFLIERHGVCPADALHMATRAGAEALGFDNLGRLERGCPADLAVISLPSGCKTAHDALADPSSRNICTIIAGEVRWRAHCG